MKFDLLKNIENGGCSAKLSAALLKEALQYFPKPDNPNLLVNIDTHDDAGVYKINDEQAIIQTTDFFPPVCSDPYEFGQIAAANALSDVYAMGGEVITALNILMCPADFSVECLREILKGGNDKVIEAGGVIVGGHTLDDKAPKYGLAVTGLVHPHQIITNSSAKPGDILILTKPLGGGVIMAGKKINEIGDTEYRLVLENMKQLNRNASQIMQKYKVKCATDITGYGLLGHALKMAEGSGVSMKIHSQNIPLFDGAYKLIKIGCIPNAAFRNQEFAQKDCRLEKSVAYENKMLLFDAQTSGGLLISAQANNVGKITHDLIHSGYPHTAIIGEVMNKKEYFIHVD